MFIRVLELIKKSNNIAILTHDNADGDAIGSALMLDEFIKLNYPNKNVDIFTDSTNISENFQAMLGNIVVNPVEKNYQLAISVDCADNGRFEKYNHVFAKADFTVNIDHHKDNAQYADLNFVSNMSSNCEHLFYLLKATSLKINKRLASCACVGVLTDSMELSIPTVTAQTYKLMTEFLALGVDVYGIRKMLFSGKDLPVFKLISTALNNAEFLCDNRVLFININKRDIQKCRATEEQVSEVISNVFYMSKCLACFLVSPRKSYWHVSMRCVDGLNVNVIAKSMGGGGHICASATNTRISITNMKTLIESEMTKQINNYTSPNHAKFFE